MTERTVSVTELARFCHRRGSIDSRFGPSPTGPEGIEGHQRLYRRRPASYQSEHAVEYRYSADGLDIALRGRADGYDPQGALVEEIKTCRVAPGSIPDAVSDLHLAQGRLYAAIICARDQLEGLSVQVTWLNIDTDEEHRRLEQYSAAELGQFLASSLGQFHRWLVRVESLRARRDASATGLPFPHGEFRDGQREIAELAYKCMDQGGQLLVEAPTGIGKTAAVLYPALKALALNKHDKLVYVTAKTVGRLAAEETIEHCRQQGFTGAALSLSARDRICFSPGKACHGEDCPFARDYYDKLPAAMDAALDAPALRRQEIEAVARQFEVCPYELALDLLPWSDIVIADLHYVYGLTGLLASAMEDDGLRWSVLLDEAHNLPDRARGMYSTCLAKAALMRARREAPRSVTASLERVNRRMLELAKQPWDEQDYHLDTEPPEKLSRALLEFTADVSEALGQEPTFLSRAPLLREFFFDALHFLRVADQWGPEYRLQLSRGSGRQSLQVALTCLDPARLLAPRQERAHSVSAFSATLTPMDWSRLSLGLSEGAVCHRAVSPFGSEQLQVSINTRVDTRYRRRADTLPALAASLRSWLRDTAGNCLVYFPSYRYMQDCLDLLGDLHRDRTLWVQEAGQTEQDRIALLAQLREQRDLAAFCILGGVLGEGIDLPGESLSSVVIVGTGMPQVNRDTRELQAWYTRTAGAGFEFAFLYPGMQKVAQALGRVVRTSSDRGSALLIDPRYAEQAYRQLLPPWWQYRSQDEDADHPPS